MATIEIQAPTVLALGGRFGVEPLDRAIRRDDDPLQLATQPEPR